jgi:hypothetical protein
MSYRPHNLFGCFVVGVIMTLLIYEVITHSYMNEKIGTRHRLNSRSNTLKCIIDNYNYKRLKPGEYGGAGWNATPFSINVFKDCRDL